MQWRRRAGERRHVWVEAGDILSSGGGILPAVEGGILPPGPGPESSGVTAEATAATPAENGKPHSHFEHEEDFFTKLYRWFMAPMLSLIHI